MRRSSGRRGRRTPRCCGCTGRSAGTSWTGRRPPGGAARSCPSSPLICSASSPTSVVGHGRTCSTCGAPPRCGRTSRSSSSRLLDDCRGPTSTSSSTGSRPARSATGTPPLLPRTAVAGRPPAPDQGRVADRAGRRPDELHHIARRGRLEAGPAAGQGPVRVRAPRPGRARPRAERGAGAYGPPAGHAHGVRARYGVRRPPGAPERAGRCERPGRRVLRGPAAVPRRAAALRRDRAQGRRLRAGAHLGQLGFYVAVVDDQYRESAIHAPTVGILLCTGKTGSVVRYSLAFISAPVAVADYQGLPADRARHRPRPPNWRPSWPPSWTSSSRRSFVSLPKRSARHLQR